MNLSSTSYLLLAFALMATQSAASSPAKSAVEDDFPKLRGSRLLTLAQDFVANQAFDYNAILRQKDKEIKQKGKNKSNEEGDQFGAWRTTPLQCIGSGEACYIGDTCCGGGQCPACNIGPCRCNES